MPFDLTKPDARPYIRENTAALAALVASNPGHDVLRAVYAELMHRTRPAALRLREELAARIMAEPAEVAARMVPAAAMPEPGAAVPGWAPEVVPEVVPCINGEVAPEFREVVVSVTRGGVAAEDAGTARHVAGSLAASRAWAAAERAAKPWKVAPHAKAERRPGDIGWKPRTLEAMIRRAGVPAYSFGPEWFGLGGALQICREAGLLALGWAPAGQYGEGYAMMARGAERCIFSPITGAIYRPGWAPWSEAERREVAEAGRAILGPVAVRAHRIDASNAAAAGRRKPRRNALTVAAMLARLHRKAERAARAAEVAPEPVAEVAPSHDASLWPRGVPVLGIPDAAQMDEAPAPLPTVKEAAEAARAAMIGTGADRRAAPARMAPPVKRTAAGASASAKNRARAF